MAIMDYAFSPIDGPSGFIDKLTENIMTFGVEMEFVVAALTEKENDPDPEDDRIARGIISAWQDSPGTTLPTQNLRAVRGHLAKTLNEACKEGIYEPMYPDDPSEKEQPFHAVINYARDFRSWIVKHDVSIRRNQKV